MPGTPDLLDALGLRNDRESPLLRFGSVDVSYAVRQATTHAGLNERSTANIELMLGLLAGQPVDYLSIVTLGSRGGQRDIVRFTGNVLETDIEAGVVRLIAETAPELTEQQLGFLEIKNAVVPETIHLAVSTAGFPEDRIDIADLDEVLPLETVEVIVPVHGVQVEEPVDFGPIRLLPREAGVEIVDEFNASEARDRFQTADAYLVGMRVVKRLLDAETTILAQADEALAWLTVRARYGLALMPNGQPQAYKRVVARARPRRGDLVLVRGMASGRRWFRAPTGREEDVVLALDSSDPTWTPPSSRYELQNRQALLACERAGHATDPLERIQALWEAIEFHVAGVRPSLLFDKKEVCRIRKSIPKDIDPKLRDRALQLLGKINDPPLFAKLVEATRQDGVPLAEGELSLLRRLRDARNDAVHGRSPDLPLREEVDHAVSIVARILVYRLQRWRSRQRSPENRES